MRTPSDPDTHLADPFFWGAYHMAPWCNRLDAVPTDVKGTTVALASNFPDGSAIHGQVYATPWKQVGDTTFKVQAGGDGWPWSYSVEVHFNVSRAQLGLEYVVANRADSPMPVGCGLHPWFGQPIHVRIPASGVFPTNAHTAALPIGPSNDLDLRRLTGLPPNVDATWVDLDPPQVELRWPCTGIAATIDVPEGTVMVAARPESVGATAVEPQTHAPAGLRRLLNDEPYGLRSIPPGERLTFAVTLEFARV